MFDNRLVDVRPQAGSFDLLTIRRINAGKFVEDLVA